MMSFISCRDKRNFSRNESPNLPSYPSKRIQFIRAWPSLSFHIFYVKCPMILLENKNTWFDFTGADPELLMRGVSGEVGGGGGGGGARFDQISYLPYVFGKTDLSKQRRPRSDAGKCGVWSGSTLFAILPAILHRVLLAGFQVDLKISIRWK